MVFFVRLNNGSKDYERIGLIMQFVSAIFFVILRPFFKKD
jgi:hypothetical protein